MKELGRELNVQLEEGDISTAHRLPDTKSTKNRIIAKFVRRDKKDELYNARKNLRARQPTPFPRSDMTPIYKGNMAKYLLMKHRTEGSYLARLINIRNSISSNTSGPQMVRSTSRKMISHPYFYCISTLEVLQKISIR